MTKRKQTFSVIFTLLGLLLLGCTGYESKPVQFIFNNYTNDTFTNTVISAGEVVDDQVIVQYADTLRNIFPKGTNRRYQTSTEASTIWHDIFEDFIFNSGDFGCLIFEFSDGRSLFIEIDYYSDFLFSSPVDINGVYQINIQEDAIESDYKAEEINGVAVGDFTIVR